MPRIVRPDLFRFRETEIGSPVGSTTGRSIKRNKELVEISDQESAQSSAMEEVAGDQDWEQSCSISRNVITALAICFVGVLLEGLCAGSKVKEYLYELKRPAFSPPLWAWLAIGAVYYFVVFVCAYRILQHPETAPFRNSTLTALLVIVVLNAFWNVLFFRAKNLRAAFFFSLSYSLVVIVCWYYSRQRDKLAAIVLGLYAIYMAYANFWGYRFWRLNSGER
jgi:tryptophan-rich sensory protein